MGISQNLCVSSVFKYLCTSNYYVVDGGMLNIKNREYFFILKILKHLISILFKIKHFAILCFKLDK